MTIADALNAELMAAAADLERGCDRAAEAAVAYIMRRLQQLERRFPRHKFTFVHRTGCGGLCVYPQVNRTNSVEALLTTLCSRSTRWETMRRLHGVSDDLHKLAYRIEEDFERLVGLIEAQGATTPRLTFRDGADGDERKAYDKRLGDRMKADERRLNRAISRRRANAR